MGTRLNCNNEARVGNQENDPLLQGTWSDLEESFGAKTLNRGKGYQSSDRVKEVALAR
jgi:uncharacterized Zn finger protein